MFGSHWDKAEATIVARQAKYSGDGSSAGYEFVADVRRSSGASLRATIQEPTIAIDFWPPNIGATVSVLVRSKDDKVKFDKDDRRISVKAYEKDRQRDFEAARNQEVGSPVKAEADPAVRLTKLETLRDLGLLTDDEFDAQRQRILDSI